jgi:hypothetical protein
VCSAAKKAKRANCLSGSRRELETETRPRSMLHAHLSTMPPSQHVSTASSSEFMASTTCPPLPPPRYVKPDNRSPKSGTSLTRFGIRRTVPNSARSIPDPRSAPGQQYPIQLAASARQPSAFSPHRPASLHFVPLKKTSPFSNSSPDI